LVGINIQKNGTRPLDQKNKNERITACKQYSLAAGATQGNIAYTQNVIGHFKKTDNMKNQIKLFTLLTLILILSIGISSCKKDDFENKQTLKKLYKTYKNGEISECKYNGQTVYSAGLNAYDAGGAVYDKDGKQIGTCNYAWGQPDPICGQLTDCETIYRVKDNIWGQPAVDKYELGK